MWIVNCYFTLSCRNILQFRTPYASSPLALNTISMENAIDGVLGISIKISKRCVNSFSRFLIYIFTSLRTNQNSGCGYNRGALDSYHTYPFNRITTVLITYLYNKFRSGQIELHIFGTISYRYYLICLR